MRAIVDVPVSAVEWWIASELDLPVVSYTALGTDRYPPFTLADVPDYPARLDLEYPQQLNRWRPLVKWLLAVPQYILVGALVGSGYVISISVQENSVLAIPLPA